MARFFKTRGLATNTVLGGHVQLDGVPVKPAKAVRPCERVEIPHRNGFVDNRRPGGEREARDCDGRAHAKSEAARAAQAARRRPA